MAGFIVLAIGLILNWIPMSLICMLIFNYPNGLYVSLFLIVAAGAFALSPMKENIGRMTLGCRPATTEERSKIMGAWNSVVAAIGQSLEDETKERFKQVELFVSDEKLPNAFALGRNTICVTKGLLKMAAPNSIAGVLAHEAGHLHFGDSQRLAIALTANQIGIASYHVLNVGAKLLEAITKAISDTGASFARSGGLIFAMAGLACWIGAFVVKISFQVLCFLAKVAIDISTHAVGRDEEFRADLFAKNIGFGQPLAKFLRRIEAFESAPKNIWQVLYRTHPPTAERIDRLENS